MAAEVSRKTVFGFIGPAVIGLAMVGIAPLLYAVWTSLHFYNLTKLKRVEFIGLENYFTVLTDEVFWHGANVLSAWDSIAAANHFGARHRIDSAPTWFETA